MTTTFTHTGNRAAVGYQHTGKHFNHYEKTSGKVHALNTHGYRTYKAVCGVVVRDDSNDCHDQDGGNPIELATAGVKVTCKACLRRLPVAVPVPKKVKFVVMLETQDGARVRWYSDSSEKYCEEMADRITLSGRASVTQATGFVLRAWVERVEE